MINEQPTESELEVSKAIADALNVTLQLEQQQINPKIQPQQGQCASPADTYRARSEFLIGNE